MDDIDLKNNGHGDIEGLESQEDLETAYKKLTDLAGKGSNMFSLSKQDLSVLKTIVTASADEELKKHVFWRMCSFLDKDEAMDHVAAYHEAKDLGMDTGFNIDCIFALVSAHSPKVGTNLISDVLGTMMPFNQWTQQQKGNKNNNANNSRTSPLSE